MNPGIQDLRFSVGEVGDFSADSITAAPPRKGLATRPKLRAMPVCDF